MNFEKKKIKSNQIQIQINLFSLSKKVQRKTYIPYIQYMKWVFTNSQRILLAQDIDIAFIELIKIKVCISISKHVMGDML